MGAASSMKSNVFKQNFIIYDKCLNIGRYAEPNVCLVHWKVSDMRFLNLETSAPKQTDCQYIKGKFIC